MTGPGRQLVGRAAVVTGAGRGIGRATAVELARSGVTAVGVLARSTDELDQTASFVREAGSRAELFTVDLADVGGIEGIAADILDRLGPVDVLVNNAATVAPLGPTASLAPAEMDVALRLNVIAPAILAGRLIRPMLDRGWGRIVNVSSGVAAHPANMQGGSTYAATKAALEAQTIGFAAEHAGTGVTINAYRPGTVDTAMQEWIRGRDPEEIGHTLHDRFVAYKQSGALITPEESAAALVAHLPLDGTGQVWSVSDRL